MFCHTCMPKQGELWCGILLGHRFTRCFTNKSNRERLRRTPFDIDYIIPNRNEPSYLLWFTLAITANEESKNINT